MHSRADAHVEGVRPRPGGHLLLNRHRRRERSRCVSEDREEFVAAGVDLVPAGLADDAAHDPPHGRHERRVAVVEAREKLGRAFDIGQQERDVALRQPSLRL